MVIRKGYIITLVGLGTGLVGAMVITRFMSGMFYRTNVPNPATFVLGPALLSGVVVLPCYLPDRSAAKIDPMEALRYE